MEPAYVIAMTPAGERDEDYHLFGQAHSEDDFAVAILHRGYAGMGGQQLLDRRIHSLMRFIRRFIYELPVKDALARAFRETDFDLRQLLKGPFAADGADLLWRTRDNTTVVVIKSGIAYVAGRGRVLLARQGKEYYVLDQVPERAKQSKLRRGLPVSWKYNDDDMDTFNEVRINDKDTYLLVPSEGIWRFVWADDDLVTLFEDRVAAFGLVEAAKDIVGYYEDDEDKILIVKPLHTKPCLLPSQAEEGEYVDYLAGIKPEWVNEDFDDLVWSFLRPIVKGKRQVPMARMTSLPYLKEVEPMVEVCEIKPDLSTTPERRFHSRRALAEVADKRAPRTGPRMPAASRGDEDGLTATPNP